MKINRDKYFNVTVIPCEPGWNNYWLHAEEGEIVAGRRKCILGWRVVTETHFEEGAGWVHASQIEPITLDHWVPTDEIIETPQGLFLSSAYPGQNKSLESAVAEWVEWCEKVKKT